MKVCRLTILNILALLSFTVFPGIVLAGQQNLFDISKIEPRAIIGDLKVYFVERVQQTFGEKVTIKFDGKISLKGNREFKFQGSDYCMDGLDEVSKNLLPRPSDEQPNMYTVVCIENQQSENAMAAGGELSKLPENIKQATIVFDQLTLVKYARDTTYHARFVDLGDEEKQFAATEEAKRRDELTGIHKIMGIGYEDEPFAVWVEDRYKPDPSTYPSEGSLLHSTVIVVSKKGEANKEYDVTDHVGKGVFPQLITYNNDTNEIYFLHKSAPLDEEGVRGAIFNLFSVLNYKTGSVRFLFGGAYDDNITLSPNVRYLAARMNAAKNCKGKIFMTIFDLKIKKGTDVISPGGRICGGSPIFSPDSKWIAYTVSSENNKQKATFIVSIDGRGNKQIAKTINGWVERWLSNTRILIRQEGKPNEMGDIHYSIDKNGKNLRNETKIKKTFSNKKLGIRFEYPSYMPVTVEMSQMPASGDIPLWTIGFDERTDEFGYMMRLSSYRSIDMTYASIKDNSKKDSEISDVKEVVIGKHKAIQYNQCGESCSAIAFIFTPSHTFILKSKFDSLNGAVFSGTLKSITFLK
ncbi:MAG: hypothetical protein Q7R79_05245 [bacterium]|nr:hypothetical protein [bacterium]